MSNLTINTFAATSQQQQLQQLLEQQASIQAQIESISAGSQLHHRSPIHKQHHRRSEIPRSLSTSGAPPMSRHLSADRAKAAAISRSLSQRSATSMARTNSRGSTSQRSGGSIPFVSNSNGTVRPLPLPTNIRQDNVVMEDWSAREQPFSPYAPSHQSQPLSRSISQHKSELQRVPEHSRFLEDLTDPSEYLKTLPYGGHLMPGLSLPPSISTPDLNMMNSHRSSTGSFDYQTPSTPSTAQLTHATTFDNTMSRTSSNYNDNIDLSMMRINSSTSYAGLSPVDHVYDQFVPTSSPCHIRSSSEEQKQLLAGAGGASHDSQFSHSLPPFQDSSSFGTKMEKSDSNESSTSSSSRSKMRLKAQNENARPLAPRGGDENAMSRSGSSQSMLRSGSKDEQDKVAISKPTYQRPKHDRVYCKQCENHPEGFRGEHELRRHQDREHKTLVKKFICVEGTGEGRLKPVLPLSKCKACGQLKREYGVYYNAAAHLRRAHFKPKVAKGRGKGLKDAEEKRGGTGGGNWPSMAELKHWMKEIEVVVTVENDASQQDQEQDEADLSEDEADAVPEPPQSFVINNNVNINNVNTNNTNNNAEYQNAYFADAAPFYQQPDMSFDMSVPLDLQSQYTDSSSMFYGSSQENSAFFSSHVLQNDPLAFVPQPFADSGSLTGLEFQNFHY